jgi:hypothetical protein
MEQASIILSIQALQFVLEVVLPAEASYFDRFVTTFAMLTDLMPLIAAVLPDGPCGGHLPVGTQMILLAAALLNTAQRIFILFTGMIPAVFAALVMGWKLGKHATIFLLRKIKEKEEEIAIVEDGVEGGGTLEVEGGGALIGGAGNTGMAVANVADI